MKKKVVCIDLIISPSDTICGFESVYVDDDRRVAEDIHGDYLVLDRASLCLERRTCKELVVHPFPVNALFISEYLKFSFCDHVFCCINIIIHI